MYNVEKLVFSSPSAPFLPLARDRVPDPVTPPGVGKNEVVCRSRQVESREFRVLRRGYIARLFFSISRFHSSVRIVYRAFAILLRILFKLLIDVIFILNTFAILSMKNNNNNNNN